MSHYNEIKEKRQILREMYGGMMSLADLTKELGYGSPKSARSWLATVDVEPVRVGRGIRYETDQVAKARRVCVLPNTVSQEGREGRTGLLFSCV